MAQIDFGVRQAASFELASHGAYLKQAPPLAREVAACSWAILSRCWSHPRFQSVFAEVQGAGVIMGVVKTHHHGPRPSMALLPP